MVGLIAACASSVSDKDNRLAEQQNQVTWESLSAGNSRVGQSRFQFRGTPKFSGPVRLIGLDDRDVEALLGTPALQRRERPAQYWRYNFAGCMVDIYFYADGQDRDHRVKHFELRPSSEAGQGNNLRCRLLADRLHGDDAGATGLSSH